jgi:hypothetical protein
MTGKPAALSYQALAFSFIGKFVAALIQLPVNLALEGP